MLNPMEVMRRVVRVIMDARYLDIKGIYLRSKTKDLVLRVNLHSKRIKSRVLV